jgi:hypothetical protein
MGTCFFFRGSPADLIRLTSTFAHGQMGSWRRLLLQHSTLKTQETVQAGRASMHQKGDFPEKERRGRGEEGREGLRVW